MLNHLITLFAGPLLLVSAAAPSIGIIKSAGEFRVDGSAVRGNGTVFEGNLIETAAARSVIQLADAQITLAPGSRARVYRDHTVLEKGSGFIRNGARHVIEVASLRVAASARDSVVQIDILGPSRVTVDARGGPAEVRNSSGVLAARMSPGTALAFDSQAAAETAVRMVGVIESRDGLYFVTDETTKVTFQIEGPDVLQFVGKKVEITGSTIPDTKRAASASQLVHAVTIKPVGEDRDKAAAAAGAAGAGGAAGAAGAGAGTAAGISGVAIAATVIGGVAVVTTVGVLAANGTFDSSEDAPLSRP